MLYDGNAGYLKVLIIMTKKLKLKKPKKLSKQAKSRVEDDFLTSASPHLRKQDRPSRKSKSKDTSFRKVKSKTQKYVADAQSLTGTELKEKYTTTYNSWKNMKQRKKTHGAVISPEFEKFPSFLIEMGPRPSREHTLDRLDNSNPMYGPKLCAWRDKTEQANNRSSTIFLEHEGQRLPLTVWAAQTEQKADTMRRRRRDGWSDEEVITGKRQDYPFGTNPLTFKPWCNGSPEDIRLWEERYRDSHKRDRYRFLIDWMQSKINPLEEFLINNLGDAKLANVCKEKQEQLNSLRDNLKRIRASYVEWQKAAQAYRAL